jgi:hypothetical protein
MKRREFIAGLPALTSASLLAPALAQQGPPRPDPVEQQTAGAEPAIALNHLGFRPQVGGKVLIVRANKTTSSAEAAEFTLRDLVPPFKFTRRLRHVESALGPALIGDFSDFTRPGLYQITVGGERSVPFFIRDDVWRRTLPKAVGYYRYQRCGVEVPLVHEVCHLDDARRRDTGEHVDTVGGWHDAGDLRKWMDVTMLNGIALLQLRRNNANPRPGDPTDADLLDEVRHGNTYFLKMQDADGKVWHDVAGGVNGDNSDNHWTDNIIGTNDDRYLDPAKQESISAIFATLEALAAQAFSEADPPYAARCLAAAERCWNAWQPSGGALELAWWTLAGCELLRATGRDAYRRRAASTANRLAALQNTSFISGQQKFRGFWMANDGDPQAFYFNVVYTALPALALLEGVETLTGESGVAAADVTRWHDSVRLYLNEYVVPMTALSAYRILPIGVFRGSPTPEIYRPLAGDLTYRFFMPVRKQFWWQGTNCHFAQHALLLARYARLSGASDPWLALAYRQLEWIMGANPFGACMMTGEGMRNPYPHSRFVGLIPGGIMNGIAGNAADEPVLDRSYGIDWRTCEYWSPHVAFYIWAHAVLENAGA